jgi:short-subunit dehydrogenase
MTHPSRPVVLLTGAAHGIGQATTLKLAVRGYSLSLIDRDRTALDDTVERLRSQGVLIAGRVADVTDGNALEEAVRELETEVGFTEILVACAGIGGLARFPHLDPSALLAMLDVNVVGVARAIEAVLPGMMARRCGHIVGISSVAGYRGLPWMPSYSASKAALSAYLEGIRPALKRRGISITTVYPGFVRTALTADTPFRRPMPMLEPEQAAGYMIHAIERRPRDYVFPFTAAVGMGLLRILPDRWFDWMMDRAGPRALTTEF